jgi:hypothetical protein
MGFSLSLSACLSLSLLSLYLSPMSLSIYLFIVLEDHAYADVYTCSPPKLFIPTMCLLQIAVLIYYEVYSSESSIYTLLVKLTSFAWDFLCLSLPASLFPFFHSICPQCLSLSIYLLYWKTIPYADVYTCSPPKLFIPTVCLLQIAVLICYEVYSSKSSCFLTVN